LAQAGRDHHALGDDAGQEVAVVIGAGAEEGDGGALQAAQRAQARALRVAQGRQALAAGLQLGRLALTLAGPVAAVGAPLYPCGSGAFGVLAPMRALAAVLFAAFVTCLSGAGPVSAQESSTPGIWINPELGLATPADAAERYKAPFHTWLVDHWGEPEEPDWRRRIFFRMIRFGDDDHGPRISHKAASCAVMRTAYANDYGFGGFSDEPHSLLNWERGLTLLDQCLARLQPLAPDVETGPGFLARRRTALRLSPLLLTDFHYHVCRAVDAERAGVPGLYNRLRRWWPDFHRAIISEGTPWTEAHGEIWTIRSERESVEAFQGLRFQPRLLLETDEMRFIVEVWGIGALDGDPRPHLVVVVEEEAKGPFSGYINPAAFAGILVYDPEQDLFRATNLDDFMIRVEKRPKDCHYELDIDPND
jgi:hypothetical protein